MMFFLTDQKRATWFGCIALASFLATLCVAVSLFAQGVIYLSRTQLAEWGLVDDANLNNIFLMTQLLSTLIMTAVFFAILMNMRGPDPDRKERPDRHDRQHDRHPERQGHGQGERRGERERAC